MDCEICTGEWDDYGEGRRVPLPPLRKWLPKLVPAYVNAILPDRLEPLVYYRGDAYRSPLPAHPDWKPGAIFGKGDPKRTLRHAYWHAEERDSMKWHRWDRGRGGVSRGLCGLHEVAVAFGRDTRAWCVDLDVLPANRSAVPLWDVYERRKAVLVALGLADENVATFRTPSTGLHLWGFLDRPERSEEVRGVIVARLEAGGLEVRPGWIEVYPHGKHAIRLPGTKGSDWYDPENGVNICSTPRRKRRAKLAIGPIEWVDAIKRQEQTAKLVAAVPRLRKSLASFAMNPVRSNVDKHRVRSLGTGATCARPADPPGTADPAPPTPTAWTADPGGWHARIAGILARGVTDPGARHDDAGALVWDLVVRQGMTATQAVERVKAWWLATQGGASKLAARRGVQGSLARVLTDAKRYAGKLAILASAGKIKGADREKLATREIARVRSKARALGRIGVKWQDAAVSAAMHIIPRKGQPVRVHSDLWIGWSSRRKYLEMRALVCAVLGLAKVGGYKKAVHAQRWVCAWRKEGEAAGTEVDGVAVIKLGARVLVLPVGGQARWARGRPWDDPDDVQVRVAELEDLMSKARETARGGSAWAIGASERIDTVWNRGRRG